MRRAVGLSVVVLTGLAGASLAAPSEVEQRLACMGDAVRLCAGQIPDHAAIEACMAAKHDQLSQGCVVVFDASHVVRKTPAH